MESKETKETENSASAVGSSLGSTLGGVLGAAAGAIAETIGRVAIDVITPAKELVENAISEPAAESGVGPVTDDISNSLCAAMPQSLADVEGRAYRIYESEGHPEGRALDHWIQAEREVGS